MVQLTHIKFHPKYFDAVLCLNGDLPYEIIKNFVQQIPILAADGAGIKLYKQGIEANYIIGDLDSFYSDNTHSQILNTTLIHKPEQDTNDFEKSLSFALKKNIGSILVFGMQGGEMEHTLNNWSIIMKMYKKMELCIYDKGRYGIPISHSFNVVLKKNETISIIPQPEAVLSSHNLKWELDNTLLKLGLNEGARNQTTDKEITVHIHKGSILFFCDARLPFAPNFE